MIKNFNLYKPRTLAENIRHPTGSWDFLPPHGDALYSKWLGQDDYTVSLQSVVSALRYMYSDDFQSFPILNSITGKLTTVPSCVGGQNSSSYTRLTYIHEYLLFRIIIFYFAGVQESQNILLNRILSNQIWDFIWHFSSCEEKCNGRRWFAAGLHFIRF